MTTRDLVNYILLTGQKGYKDMEDGNRISDKMTLLVKEHIKAEADKMVEERLIEFGEMIRDEPNGDIEYFIRTINLKTREK